MKVATARTRDGIKAEQLQVVKPLFVLLFLLFLGQTAHSAPPIVVVPVPLEPSDIDRNMPDVEVRTFPVSVLKRSAADGVYLFEDPTAALPASGKILLLKKDTQPVMALRVLKVYLEKKEFAAKRLRFYHEHKILGDGEKYTAYEKIADIPLPPALSAQDKADIRTLEEEDEDDDGSDGNALPLPENGAGQRGGKLRHDGNDSAAGGLDQPESYDPELDAESSPPPVGAVDSAGRSLDEEGELSEGGHTHMMVEDVNPIEPNRHGLSAQLGYFQNTYDGSPVYFVGGGFRFSYIFKRMEFLRKPDLQDSFAWEAGLFMYKTMLQSSTTNLNAYNIFPLVGTVRYQVHVGETFTGFAYAGLLKNFSIAAPGSDVNQQVGLSGVLIAGGIGGLFRIGPSWDIRLDLGMDFVGGGLVLGF